MKLINSSMENFGWPKLILGTNVHEKVILFDKTILIFFHKFVLNKNIICDVMAGIHLGLMIKQNLEGKLGCIRNKGKQVTLFMLCLILLRQINQMQHIVLNLNIMIALEKNLIALKEQLNPSGLS